MDSKQQTICYCPSDLSYSLKLTIAYNGIHLKQSISHSLPSFISINFKLYKLCLNKLQCPIS